MTTNTIHVIGGRTEVLDVLGARLEFLVTPSEGDLYCVVKGTIPPRMSVGLHSHPDAESFFVASGAGQVLIDHDGRLEWLDVAPGDFFHIPGGTKHAHRNTSSHEPLVELLITSITLGRFFLDVGRPVAGDALPPPTQEDLDRFAAIAAEHGHWLATPAENAAAGLNI